MKIITVCMLVFLLGITACASQQAATQPAQNKVGYQTLSRLIQPGQRLEVEMLSGAIIRIQVIQFTGDIITAIDLNNKQKRMIDINKAIRIRLL